MSSIFGIIDFNEKTYSCQPHSQIEHYKHLLIIAEARIDNRQELCRSLACQPDDKSDAQLIGMAFEKWQTQCVNQLIGDFAFVIWDEQKQLIFCARDHIGVVPLYFHKTDTFFAFATDLKQLINLGPVPIRVDEAEIAQFLLHHESTYIQLNRTFFKDIDKLQFGHHLIVTQNTLKQTQYWSYHLVTPNELSVEECIEELQARIQQAVHDRIQHAEHIGAHLSGGLDSSLLAVIAARHQKQKNAQYTLFSWSPQAAIDDQPYTEISRINAICQQENITCNYFDYPPAYTWLMNLDPLTRPADTINQEYFLAEYAQKHNIKVMISGWGGDQTSSFHAGGYEAELFMKGHWRKLFTALRGRKGYKRRGNLRHRAKNLWNQVIMPFMPAPLYRKFDSKALTQKPSTYFLQNDFDAYAKKVTSKTDLIRIPERNIRLTQKKYFEMGLITHRLESWAWLGHEFNTRYVFPLLDRRVMEFAYSMPSEAHYNNGWYRYTFRQICDRFMPTGMAWDQYGNVKKDTILNQASQSQNTQIAQGTQAKFLEIIERNQGNPWVDTAQLKNALNTLNTPQDQFAFWRAIRALLIWEHYN